MKKFLIVLLSFSCLGNAAFALKEYYSISESVRALGMGGAFYGMSDDQYALFYNPAGLSLYRMDSQMMFGLQTQVAPQTLSAISTLTGSGKTISNIVDSVSGFAGKPLYGGVGLMPFYVKKHFAIGLLLADTKVNFALLGKELDSDVDLTAIMDNGLVIGYGRSIINPNLHVGMNLKGIFRAGGRRTFTILDIAQSDAFKIEPRELGGAGFGVDADLGAIYELQNVPWGLANRVSVTINNILATKFGIARQLNAPPGLPRMLTLSYYTVLPGWKFIDNFHIVLDLAEFQLGGDNSDVELGGRQGNLFKHINFGVEMPMNRWFALRTGFRQGYLSAGMGVSFKAMKMDLAYYGEELSNQPGRLQSRRIALNLTFGSGSSAPAPLSRDTFLAPNEIETPKAGVKDPAPDVKVDPKQPPQTNDDLLRPESEMKKIEVIDVGKDKP